MLSGKDLYKQTIIVSARGEAKTSSKDAFPVRFLNIFVDYLLGQMCVGDKFWTHWNKAPMRLWQMQLNFVVWCADGYGRHVRRVWTAIKITEIKKV